MRFRARITQPIMKGDDEMDLKKARIVSSRIIQIGFMSYSAIRGAEHIQNSIKSLVALFKRKGR